MYSLNYHILLLCYVMLKHKPSRWTRLYTYKKITPLIEGYQSTIYFIIYHYRFNPFHFYAMFHGYMTYGNSSICPYLLLLDKGLCTVPHICSLFCCTLALFHVLYNSAVWYLYFRLSYFYLLFFFPLITASQYTMKRVFNIMSCTNNIWIGVACNMM